jgi:hypothetical protein
MLFITPWNTSELNRRFDGDPTSPGRIFGFGTLRYPAGYDPRSCAAPRSGLAGACGPTSSSQSPQNDPVSPTPRRYAAACDGSRRT